MVKTPPYSVLLVDDSEDDRLFMRRAFRDSAKLKIVGEARDGEEAIAYLRGDVHFSNRSHYPFPDVILLDLKMPKKTGYDVLEWLRTSAFKDLIPIVVSGSSLAEDIAKSFSLGARGYHKKTALKDEQEVMLREIEAALEKTASV